MTANTIAYYNYLETVRANRAREAEDRRSNMEKENETRRHNVVSEATAYGTLRESARHNLETEAISSFSAGETARHNHVQEELGQGNLVLGWGQLAETERSHRASESEIHRSNLVNETLRAADVQETVRSNQAREALQSEQLEESKRQFNVQTGLKNMTLALDQRDLNERARHNRANEGEQQRHNQEMEALEQWATKLKQAQVIYQGIYGGVETVNHTAKTISDIVVDWTDILNIFK